MRPLAPHWRGYRRGAQALPNIPVNTHRSLFSGVFRRAELGFILCSPQLLLSLDNRYPRFGLLLYAETEHLGLDVNSGALLLGATPVI